MPIRAIAGPTVNTVIHLRVAMRSVPTVNVLWSAIRVCISARMPVIRAASPATVMKIRTSADRTALIVVNRPAEAQPVPTVSAGRPVPRESTSARMISPVMATRIPITAVPHAPTVRILSAPATRFASTEAAMSNASPVSTNAQVAIPSIVIRTMTRNIAVRVV